MAVFGVKLCLIYVNTLHTIFSTIWCTLQTHIEGKIISKKQSVIEAMATASCLASNRFSGFLPIQYRRALKLQLLVPRASLLTSS